MIGGVVFAVFLTLWGTVIAGQRVLVGGDILYRFQPWAGEPTAREPRNTYVGDPVTQFVAWTALVKDSYAQGEMPLWNPYALSGTPLLANDQSAPFSPFTLASLPFDPVRGVSLAMLLKLWVAGFGMVVLLRLHGAGAPAAGLAGIAYATSSFMVVWLAYPHSSVACLMPWAFAAVAWYLRDRSRLALLAVAGAVALQFLAGHAETSLHLGVGLAVYAAVRVVGLEERRGWALAGLATAAVLGCLLAGAQLVPFVANLTDASILGDRSDARTGSTHLEWRKLDSWIVPNGEGSPGIDGRSSRYPVYPESVGFAGAGALVLALTGVALVGDRRLRWPVLALLAVLGVSAGTVYGPLAPLAGRTPMLDVSNNIRLLTVMCFGVAAMAGLGLDRLLSRPPRRTSARMSRVLMGAGSTATAALGLAVAAVVFRADELGDLLPEIDGRIGFWVATGVLAVVAGAAFYGARRVGAPAPAVAGGFLAVALLEAVLFAWPYNPRVPLSESPPASATIDWLRANVGPGSVAAAGLELIPNVASAYRLRDPRGVDALHNPRLRTFWSKADPGFDDSFLYTVLSQPDARWLAAAGVTHHLTLPDQIVAGTVPVFQGPGSTVAEVPGARPFVFAAASTVTASDPDEAAEIMARDPLGPVVVERPATGADGAGVIVNPAGPAAIELLGERAGTVSVRVTATTATTIVVLQAFADGWRAEVDGARARIDPADVLFQSVQVPAGAHTVTLRYRPESFRLGLAASAAGLIGVLLVGMGPLLPFPAAVRGRDGRLRGQPVN